MCIDVVTSHIWQYHGRCRERKTNVKHKDEGINIRSVLDEHIKINIKRYMDSSESISKYG